jgi:hypothetical protein
VDRGRRCCAEGYFYSEDSEDSEDSASWELTSPRSGECNGVWTETVMNPIPFHDGVRLYRNTNDTNLPLP